MEIKSLLNHLRIPYQLVMHPLRILTASSIEDSYDSPDNQFDVTKERGVFYVIHVKFKANG